ncbi:MAG: PAS domain-containing protein [Alphaproteobacteria bacterium]|nr:MAG: PAS domain-containing protein [Alphaproteobacteria bacterium]
MPENFNVEPLHKMAISSFFETFEKVAEGGLATDAEGRIVWINQKYLAFLGIDGAAEILGRKISKVIPNSLIPQVLETGKPILFDVMEYSRGWCVVSRFPIRDGQQKIIGAFGFVLYDDLSELGPLIGKIQSLQKELHSVRKELSRNRRAKYSFHQFAGTSAAATSVRREGRLAANKSATVLLQGETGTGKELIAQSIHAASPRSAMNFVAVNVSAIPETLLEAEFFGTDPGAYTGAGRKARVGKIELANGGTLFLDEIGDMPPILQAKLLRVLQERELEPLGSNRIIPLDVRIIAATSRNLEEMVERNEFRDDLYYRLNVIPIAIPPLRDRPEDIPVLCRGLLEEIADQHDMDFLEIEPDAEALLTGYGWPGNVRELRNILERISLKSKSRTITLSDVTACLPRQEGLQLCAVPPEHLEFTGKSMAEAVAMVEKRMIVEALRKMSGRKVEAAKLLEMPTSTFYSKIREYRI